MLKDFTNFLLTTASFIGMGITIWQDIVGGGDTPVTPSWVLTADGAPAAIDFDFANNRAYVLGATGTPDSFLTCTRSQASGPAYYLNSSGTWTLATANTIRYQYNATTLAAEGAYVEESRTNSVSNNSAQGAVAGTARNVGTGITSLARTASATAVVTVTGSPTVAVNDMITITGCAVSDYNGTFAVSAVGAGTYSYVTATSTTDSAGGTPVITCVSPGTQPTGWNFATPLIGMARSIVGTGTENGIDYVDIRVAGLTTATSVIFGFYSTNTVIAASNAQTWSSSVFLTLVGGTIPGSLTFKQRVTERDGAGAALTTHDDVTPFTPVAGNLRENRKLLVETNTNAGTNFITNGLLFNNNNATMYDFTVRIGWPQMELGASVTSPIRTTSATQTRNTDNISMTLPAPLQSLAAYTVLGYGIPDTPNAYTAEQQLVSLSDGTASNRSQSTRNLTTAPYRAVVIDTGANQYIQSGGTWSQLTQGSIVLAMAAANFRAARTPNTLFTAGATGTMPVGFNKLNVGSRQVGAAAPWDGKINRTSVWNFRASDTAIAALAP